MIFIVRCSDIPDSRRSCCLVLRRESDGIMIRDAIRLMRRSFCIGNILRKLPKTCSPLSIKALTVFHWHDSQRCITVSRLGLHQSALGLDASCTSPSDYNSMNNRTSSTEVKQQKKEKKKKPVYAPCFCFAAVTSSLSFGTFSSVFITVYISN